MRDIWVQTVSGRRVDLFHPDPGSIDAGDIATALSRIPRFNGHTAFAYSVAQHSVLGASYLLARGERERALRFALHDAHEAYIGDIATPVAQGLCDEKVLHSVKFRLDGAIWRALTGRIWRERKPIVHDVADIDLRMLRTERDILCSQAPASWGDDVENAQPLPIEIVDISAALARGLWLDVLSRLLEPAASQEA